MATGEAFNEALRDKISPLVVTNIRGDHYGLSYTLSDGRKLQVKRQRVKDANPLQLLAYVTELVGP